MQPTIPFSFRDDQLCCEGVSVAALAETYGTPLYVYSKNGVLSAYQAIDRAFADIAHAVCYALKANANPHLLWLLAAAGAGADVVSGGELRLAEQAGFAAKRTVFAGVGKTNEEIKQAIDAGIAALNIESRQELEVTAALATALGKRAPIAIRINPDVDIEGHPYLTTGRTINKFGIPLDDARDCCLWAARQPSLELVGVHAHVGSMIKKTLPFRRNAEALANFVSELQRLGIDVQHIDIGGGIGVDYARVLAEQGAPLYIDPEELAKEVVPIIKATGCELFLEPGRAIVGPHGILVTRVVFTKESRGKRFVVVDAAMNDLIRPALYGAHHEVLKLYRSDGQASPADVVGPVCESGDFFAKDRLMPPVQRGDFLAIMTAGAYGYVLASTYNQRMKPAEVLVDGTSHQVIRERSW
ncbi:MAG: diaminopimelate decarboxylase [bacterium]|jgi:diaminopimelate decarboxylase|nr:diaminopimelate decarboxylase [candidate division KSB1 bacterium]MDH7559122.1 diaminopimelate decarboxylase [bacterium]